MLREKFTRNQISFRILPDAPEGHGPEETFIAGSVRAEALFSNRTSKPTG